MSEVTSDTIMTIADKLQAIIDDLTILALAMDAVDNAPAGIDEATIAELQDIVREWWGYGQEEGAEE